MPNLITGRLDFSNIAIVRRIIDAARKIAAVPEGRRLLKVRASCYFSVEPPNVPNESGWYVITANDCQRSVKVYQGGRFKVYHL